MLRDRDFLQISRFFCDLDRRTDFGENLAVPTQGPNEYYVKV